MRLLAASIPAESFPSLKGLSPRTAAANILNLEKSQSFGISQTDGWQKPGSFYTLNSDHTSALTFDSSNNQLAVSITKDGDIREACIASGLQLLPKERMKGGVYSTKTLRYSGSWALNISTRDFLHTGTSSASLIENMLPLFTSTHRGLDIHRIIFAPTAKSTLVQAPRALLYCVVLNNTSHSTKVVRLQFDPMATPDNQPQNATQGQTSDIPNSSTSAHVKFFQIDHRGLTSAIAPSSSFELNVPPKTIASVYYTVILGESEEECESTRAMISSWHPDDWLDATLAKGKSSYGTFTIEDAPILADTVSRFGELARQSALRLSDGTVCGGFLGSDVDVNQVNWVRDFYYSMLAMSIVDPTLCRDSIPYLLQWGVAPVLTGDGKKRFPNAAPISQSLSNSVSGLCLAGAYYKATGDRDFFRQKPEIKERAVEILSQVLMSKQGVEMLFPSLYYSDGEARGDFHTGSNIAAWYAFKSIARIVRDAYGDTKLSEHWHDISEQIYKAIETRCVGESDFGKRFFEGSNHDGSFVPGHDGEESETTLLPFYEFCSSDDDRIRNHAKAAMSDDNPLYARDLDAIWWYNTSWNSATFPSWITALASAGNETELNHRLGRVVQLLDFDGSVWWWPYRYGSKDSRHPLRGDVAKKCGWGAGVFFCKFVNDVLGISFDAPTGKISLAPFSPWNHFRWKGLRIGTHRFDIEYISRKDQTSISFRNRNATSVSANFTFVPRHSETFTNVRSENGRILSCMHLPYWSRSSLRVGVEMKPQEAITLTAEKRNPFKSFPNI